MDKGRLEAFSDGVLAIIITIMVLEMKVPHGEEWSALPPLLPVFLSYVLSFVYLGIYWNNHHHMLQAARHVDGGVLWANMHLLFWLSLVPFVTGWMGENHFAPIPVALYGVVLLFGGDRLLHPCRSALIAVNGKDSPIAIAIGRTTSRADLAGSLSGRASSPRSSTRRSRWRSTSASRSIWLVPDRRIERVVRE